MFQFQMYSDIITGVAQSGDYWTPNMYVYGEVLLVTSTLVNAWFMRVFSSVGQCYEYL